MLLAVFGTAAIYSASYFKAEEHFGNSHYFLGKQLMRLALGILLMLIFINIDYHVLQQIAPILFIVTVFVLIYVLIGGNYYKGSRRTIPIFSFIFQPSEFAKYALILFLSIFIVKKGDRIKDFNDGLLPTLMIIALIVGLILLEPDLSNGIIIFLISCVIVFVGGASIYHLSSLGILAITAVGFVISVFPYQKIRLFTFIDAVRGAEEPAWQVTQSLISLGNGGLWGVGLGNSRQKLHFLPQPFTDFIFSIIGEEIGLIGCSFFIILMLAFLWRGLWIAIHAPDKQGQLLAIGITSSIVIYSLFNTAIAINLFPVSGITLPFISYGGSSLVANFMAVGVMLNISSQITRDKTSKSLSVGKNYVTNSNLTAKRKRR